jgi:hypothetical protein
LTIKRSSEGRTREITLEQHARLIYTAASIPKSFSGILVSVYRWWTENKRV